MTRRILYLNEANITPKRDACQEVFCLSKIIVIKYPLLLNDPPEAAYRSTERRTYDLPKNLWNIAFGRDCESGFPGCMKSVGLREDWEDVKISEMNKIIRAKFTQNPALAERLMETGSADLIEGNTWGDTTWGYDIRKKEGRNILGNILMDLRDELLFENPQKD